MSNSRLAPALVLGALLEAINLAAGMTAVAHAQTTRQPPTQGQVGEPRHPRVSPPAPPAEPNGQPRWPVTSLAVLAAALALSGGLATRRASRKAWLGLTA